MSVSTVSARSAQADGKRNGDAQLQGKRSGSCFDTYRPHLVNVLTLWCLGRVLWSVWLELSNVGAWKIVSLLPCDFRVGQKAVDCKPVHGALGLLGFCRHADVAIDILFLFLPIPPP